MTNNLYVVVILIHSASNAPKILSKKFLALCINTGRYKTLGEIDVTNIHRNSETFRMIRERYLEIRGFRARARRLFLFQPSSVHFVKVSQLHIDPLRGFSQRAK